LNERKEGGVKKLSCLRPLLHCGISCLFYRLPFFPISRCRTVFRCHSKVARWY
jgi:hypothetical protein